MKDIQVTKLAKKLNITPQAIYKWLRGESFPSYANLKKLSKAMDKPIGEVVKLFG